MYKEGFPGSQRVGHDWAHTYIYTLYKFKVYSIMIFLHKSWSDYHSKISKYPSSHIDIKETEKNILLIMTILRIYSQHLS